MLLLHPCRSGGGPAASALRSVLPPLRQLEVRGRRRAAHRRGQSGQAAGGAVVRASAAAMATELKVVDGLFSAEGLKVRELPTELSSVHFKVARASCTLPI